MAVIGKMMLLSIMALCLLAQCVDCRRGMMKEGCDNHHKGRSRSRPGGVSEDKPKDSKSVEAVDAVKSQLEEKTGKEYESLEVLKYKQQTVAGRLYFIKVRARTVDGSESIMHLRILSQSWLKGYTLEAHQDNKTEDDELDSHSFKI